MERQALTQQLRQLLDRHPKELSRLTELLTESGENAVLLCLLRSGGSLLPGELAGKLALTSGRIANILRALEAKGLIHRLPEADDGRKMRAALTANGKALAQALEQDVSLRLDSLRDYLGDRDAEAAVLILERCLQFCQASAT